MDLQPLLAAWTLTNPVKVSESPYARVFRVLRHREPMALKLYTKERPEALRARRLYAAWDGVGATRLHASTKTAHLLQWLDGPSLGELVRQGQDQNATEILADVSLRLHSTAVRPAGLLPISEHFAALLKMETDDRLLRDAQDMARALLARDQPSRALHGDLHHDNIRHHRGHWLAFDPKGLWGPPAYELANAFLNPVGSAGRACHPDTIQRRGLCFQQRTGIPVSELWAWAFAHAGLSAAWSLEDGVSAPFAYPFLAPLRAACLQS